MSKIQHPLAKLRAATASTEPPPSEPPQNPLRCTAPGCPMPWSCDMGNGKLCSWHDCSRRIDWPAITEDLSECIRRGVEPKRRELPQATWIAATRLLAKRGPSGKALAAVMSQPIDMTAHEIAERQRKQRQAAEQYARDHGLPFEDRRL